MWVFGYGSLMWDEWEKDFGSLRRSVATLEGYCRILNKASVQNHGSRQHPCPTLNLERAEGAKCKGIAFEFPIDRDNAVREFLEDREGRNFDLRSFIIRLDDHTDVRAYTPIYEGQNLIVASTLQEKVAVVKSAVGRDGSCLAYIRRLTESLARLGIDDSAVSELWNAIRDDR
jgi:cation transport protein ChaC